MLYLVLAVLSSVLVSIIMRISGKHARNNLTMLAANYLMCSAMALYYTGDVHLFPQENGLSFALVLGIVSGIFYLGSFIMLQWNTHTNGVVLSSLFMKLGVLVPTFMSILFFHEIPTLFQLLGMIGAIAAILIINLEKGSGKAASSLGLVILLLSGGGTDGMSKIYEELGSAPLKNHFLLYAFIVAFILCVALCLIKKQGITGKDLFFGLLIGVPNYFSARFLLLSLSSVPAVVAYPTYSVGSIITVTLAGVAIFREKLSRRQLIAMGIILVALVLLNI